MDIKKYIESGILENYVLGLASPAERIEVEANMIQYPEIRQEVNAIELAMEGYADAHKVKAPSGLETDILKRIKEGTNPPKNDKPSDTKPPSNNLGLFLLGALLLASLLACGWFYNQNSKQTSELENANTSFNSLKADCDEKDADLESLRQQLLLLRDTSNLKIQMKGTDKAPALYASVIYNPNNKKSYLDVYNLPAPPTDKQYQLWAIVDGAPVDMGVFDLVVDSDTALQEVPFIENPQAFAVTLENRGGSPTPHLEDLVVIGNVSR